MFTKIVRPIVLIGALALQSSSLAQSADPCSASPDVTNTFECLFDIFPRSKGNADAPNIGWALAQEIESDTSAPISPTGPLVIVNGAGVFVYDGTPASAGKTLSYVVTRSDNGNGFTQMTALSHVGPAAAYLASLSEAGWPDTKKLTQDLIARVTTARKALKADPEWIGKLDAPSWQDHKDDINRMMDYGLWMSEDYLTRTLAGEFGSFDSTQVSDIFYDGKNKRYEVPFKHVMIATFMMVTLNSVDQLRKMVENHPEIAWKDARVLVHMPIGTNFGAGLTMETNQLAAALPVISDGAIGPDNILIAPYANAPCPGFAPIGGCPVEVFTGEALDSRLYQYYSQTAWLGIYNRTRVAEKAFPNVPDMCSIVPQTPTCQPLVYDRPGDYPATKPDDIDGFMIRLRNSLINKTELLSNAVGYWMPGALAANKWDTKSLNIPGLNAGFPKGVKAYPKK